MIQNQPTSAAEFVLILDFGGQYTQLVARRVRECHVYCEIASFDTPLEEIMARGPNALILSGGPVSFFNPDAPKCDVGIFKSGIPCLGICYGAQLMAAELGGKLTAGKSQTYTQTDLRIIDSSDIFAGLDPEQSCWISYGDVVEKTPPGFKLTARTAQLPVAAMSDPDRKLYAVQFNPESVDTPSGMDILRNFLFGQANLSGSWDMATFIETATDAIRDQVGSHKVICGVSGGIDSSCVAALVHQAIGDQLTCIFVNHGLLRLNEAEQVRRTFEDHFKIRLVYVDAEERFLRKLAGVTDPERKRKIIGEEFIRVFEEHASKIEGAKYLAQGTVYPDVIESGTKSAAVIKSHHNVGGLPEDMDLDIIEPIRQLFKDEVREVASCLGLPEDMVWRQPFPGPGLAIRVLGEVTKSRLDTLRLADSIVVDEIKAAGLYRDVWQALAILAPIRSVGVMGEQRTYADTIVLRVVTSKDAMTAEWARLPYEVLEKISDKIISEVPGVNRVVYDITPKPPATIEWE